MQIRQTSEPAAIAICTQKQAERLLPFDHHRVTVAGQAGVMITWPWLMLTELPASLELQVVFAYAQRHPPAPTAVQEIIDQLAFYPTGGAE